MSYPFEEGDFYFTIEGNSVVESIWDEQSEALRTPDKKYYKTLDEAIHYFQYMKALSFIVRTMSFIETRKPSKAQAELLEAFRNFNPNPNIATLYEICKGS
jgi:hypothetical protein